MAQALAVPGKDASAVLQRTNRFHAGGQVLAEGGLVRQPVRPEIMEVVVQRS